ncbi:DUF7569 family protein [Halalkalicoccus jeotgali]|uniref:Small CPxCG-related zinc finger protein n=1 Tax=Halalkalicoccus jeotgali (strain DSM 18796 / CECT 7217 / JCM 14584 / KCTC 4019 / B3) TaxID=795797 RepID=D8J497_HALJB|nr:hypothetical protein [Halalkalicoccus jeotgali]ADJ13459.1 hypothetical protein HacjB3_00330 [Halalkalicoccus jeotgali B3]ELY33066.1 hypothetical protein C497_19002 [Halalkalicoccus jeotgali B3]
MTDVSCDGCSEEVRTALSRTVSLAVDGSDVDSQTLCPGCFADWIERYERRMQPDPAPSVEGIDFVE